MKARIIDSNILKNRTEIIDQIDKTPIRFFTDIKKDISKEAKEDIKETVREGMYSLFENFNMVMELINILYEDGFWKREIDYVGVEKCEELLDKYGHDFLLKSDEIRDTELIFFIFNKIINMNNVSRENYLNFCQNIDTALKSNISVLVEAHLSMMDMLTRMSFTNIQDGKSPIKVVDWGLVGFDEDLDKSFENINKKTKRKL